MKGYVCLLSAGALVVFLGCSEKTSGGPGATRPADDAPMIGQEAGSFSLDVPSISLKQGGVETASVDIDRGDNFTQDVTLRIEPLPMGLSLTPPNPVIKNGVDEVEFTVSASATAAVGEFTVNIVGHPATGPEARAETTITVDEADVNAAAATNDNLQREWDDYKTTARAQLDEFNRKYEEMKTRAAEAQGDLKAEMDQKLAQAKVKLDEASLKLEEMQDASADRWEKVKDGVSAALEDLKSIFE